METRSTVHWMNTNSSEGCYQMVSPVPLQLSHTPRCYGTQTAPESGTRIRLFGTKASGQRIKSAYWNSVGVGAGKLLHQDGLNGIKYYSNVMVLMVRCQSLQQ